MTTAVETRMASGPWPARGRTAALGGCGRLRTAMRLLAPLSPAGAPKRSYSDDVLGSSNSMP